MRPTIGKVTLATICGITVAGLLCSGCDGVKVGNILAQPSPRVPCNTPGSARIDPPPEHVPSGAIFKWEGNDFVTVTSPGSQDLTVPFRTADRPGQGQITFWIEVDGKELKETRRICPLEVIDPGIPVRIESPRDGAKVRLQIDVRFSVKGPLAPGVRPVLIVFDALGHPWPWIDAVTEDRPGEWSVPQVQIGVPGRRDQGREFRLLVILTDAPIRQGQSLNSLPRGARSAVVRVVRQ